MKGKCCLACCGLTVLAVAVIVPLGLFVVGPKTAQSMMDSTEVALENSTLIQDSSMKWGMIYTQLTMRAPGPLGVTVKPYRVAMASDSVELGFFQFPKETVKVGDNKLDFTANFTITNSSALAMFGVMMMSGIPQPLALSGTVEAQTLGFLTFHPTQNVKLWCSYLECADPMAVSMKCTKDKPDSDSPVLAFSPRKDYSNFLTIAANNLPDCSTTACPSTCQCAEQKCTKELNDCLADSTCAGLQGCVDACKCGSPTCLAMCAAKHPTTLAIGALKCVHANCPTQENVASSEGLVTLVV